MILSIIIPTYNEEKTIVKILEKIKNNSSDFFNYEVIVIDDASTDQSRKLLENNKHLYDKLLVNETNKGKGFSVKRGISSASGTHIIFQDADLEYNPGDFKKFEKIFIDFDADGIIGSRFMYSNFTRSHNILNKIGNTFLTLLFNLLYNTTFTDIYSCYFAFKKNLLNVQELRTKGFEQHAEILCKIIKRGNKFYEVPISYNGRNVSEGKKIKPHHFFLVLYEIIRGRFI
jgi:glycosyltransferase involved in cell wall biosynthesis|tara:strand:+ start:1518 stop:2207 length:690 start_codon:yes stop_codon:yes gene_type:complete